ncbi:MAG: MgtC/SapB family protein [Solobacterium sp.]|nr:MgtC/SapB family protein [Solobacterium sp.]
MVIQFFIRILLAALLGAIIGFERHSKSKEAGVRTHAIVAIGSALLMLISKYGFVDVKSFDASRIAAQVVSGISFLGAGIIFVRHDNIQGLTTAAGIWTTSGIGLSIGAGLYSLGIFAAIVVVLIQLAFQTHYLTPAPRTTMNVLLRLDRDVSIKKITDVLHKYGYTCTENKVTLDPKDPTSYVLYLGVTTLKNVEPTKFVEDLKNESFIRDVELM